MKYKSHKKPSDKQLKVLALLEANPEMSHIEAGMQAGYSRGTSRNLRDNVLSRPIVKSLLDNYRYQLSEHGINPERLASKLDALLEAETKGMPDHRIQLETVKVINGVYGIDAKQEDSKVKKRITLEEFDDKEVIKV